MTKWARIEDGVVMETTSINPANRFHPSLVWVACAEEVEQGWIYSSGEFSPPEG